MPPVMIPLKILILLSQFCSFDIQNCNNRLFDLVLSNIKCCVSRESVPFVKEYKHHPGLNIALQINDTNRKRKLDYSHALVEFNFKRENLSKCTDHFMIFFASVCPSTQLDNKYILHGTLMK